MELRDTIEVHLEFDSFVAKAERGLRAGLIARYGVELGREATCEALAYAFEHWERIVAMKNPTGYLYRVGQSWATRQIRRRRIADRAHARNRPVANDSHDPWVEPGLVSALKILSRRQREVVLLVYVCDMHPDDVAALLGISTNSVRTHGRRGLSRLKHDLGVTRDG